MVQALQTDLLSRSIGISIKNHNGEPIGKIVEVVSGRDRDTIEYVILQSKNLYGSGDRFFAVPASTDLIKITTGGKIVLHADKDELQRAKGTTFDRCPKPTLHFEPSIFELYNYKESESRSKGAEL